MIRCKNCNHALIQFKGVWLHQGTTHSRNRGVIKIGSQKCYKFTLEGKCDCLEPAS